METNRYPAIFVISVIQDGKVQGWAEKPTADDLPGDCRVGQMIRRKNAYKFETGDEANAVANGLPRVEGREYRVEWYPAR